MAAAARLARLAEDNRDEDGRRRLPLTRRAVSALDETPEALFEEVFGGFQVAPGRVRCIEAEALRKLRRLPHDPARAKRLRSFLEVRI